MIDPAQNNGPQMKTKPTNDNRPMIASSVVTSFVLWHRETGRHKWRAIASGDWGPTVLEAMDGFHNGEWMLISDGTDPNKRQQ